MAFITPRQSTSVHRDVNRRRLVSISFIDFFCGPSEVSPQNLVCFFFFSSVMIDSALTVLVHTRRLSPVWYFDPPSASRWASRYFSPKVGRLEQRLGAWTVAQRVFAEAFSDIDVVLFFRSPPIVFSPSIPVTTYDF